MKYNFDKLIDRHGRDALAIDGIGHKLWGFTPEPATRPGFDEIPMWVADMNFETAPAITRALEERIKHPLYGYFMPSDAYYDAIIHWQTTRHGYTNLTKEQIGYENGVHGCIISAINSLTEPGDAVLVHSPTYVGFLGDLHETGRKTVFSPLTRDENGIWRMDFDDMDKKMSDEKIRLAIFCSPHNPTGRVWERWELEKAMALFKKHHCIVLSDEIWSDIVFAGHKPSSLSAVHASSDDAHSRDNCGGGFALQSAKPLGLNRHIPTAMVNDDARERTVGIYAPSKTFNLAGLIGSYHIIYNDLLREKIAKHGAKTHYNDMNVLSMHALIGAYSDEGAEWTDELNQVLEKNCRYAADFINDNFDGCSVAMPQGTYMLFMDCADYLKAHNKTLDDVLKAGWDVGVAYQDGRKFAHDTSIRLNCALPFVRVEEAMARLEKYVFTK